MPTKLKHYNPSASDLNNRWRVFDADGKVLGRLASEIAMVLMGKHRADYVPHMPSGDFVIVVNADKVELTGRKDEQKVYRRHSQYPGNLKEIPYSRMLERTPERIIELAVRGMLPKNKLGRKMLTRLKVYAGPDHPHSAQVIGSERAEMREASEQ
ncbi:MAG: 50S ribosomal protein L13 [Chloroflexi bacterium]|nr:50S ribosomal protein L13 [Chloroflexota bacterium]